MHTERHQSDDLPDAGAAPPEGENASGTLGEVSREEDTSGGPLSGGAGEGAGEGGPDVDVPGGADTGVEDEAVGGG
jgi:hypothetical protein